MKIAVTAATGHLGQHVIDSLLDRVRADDIVVLVRTVEKASDMAERGLEVRHFDYDKPEELAAQLDDVDRLLLISGEDFGKRAQQHRNVINAASEAGVSFLAYTSLLHPDRSGDYALIREHAETEKLLADVPFTVTILRNGWYTENLEGSAHAAMATGTIVTNAGDAQHFPAARADYAEAAAVVLTQDEPKNETLSLTGDEGVSAAEQAEIISAITGKEIKVVQISADDHRAGLLEAGVPEPLAEFIVGTEAGIATGELAPPDPSKLSELIGRPTTPVRAVFEKMLG